MLALQSLPGSGVTAILGLVGVLVTALLSNWDKLFPKKNIVKAEYTGYRPTGNFENELRYFFDVSGTRAMAESTNEQIIQTQTLNLLSAHPEDAERINREVDAVRKEAIRFDDVIKAILPVYQKHFTLSEIQELNKFYSTDVMQGMANKIPLVAQEVGPIQVQLMSDYFQRLDERLNSDAG